MLHHQPYIIFFFFNDTATTEIYTLSLHDALPISSAWTIWEQKFHASAIGPEWAQSWPERLIIAGRAMWLDRKSTRLNSSHSQISYAVFCLKKKKKYIKAMHAR